ncbi:MAG: hypothetical protein K2N48_10920 [Muribaculaceae bacterium]|nr:hypothetical protein [Muribaculaceae bacterium]
MKKLILSTMIAAAAAIPALAGVNNVNYQAVIKDGNNVVANKEVAMKFELLNGTEVVWSQEQKPTTTANGLVACQLGEGIDAIDWNADLTLQVSVDLGNGFEVISNEAVSSVPSALRSADAQELYPVVIELMEDNENTKETLLGVNAQLAQLDGFIEEVSDFHERVSEALINLNELSESYDEFNQRISDELQKLIGLDYEELGDFNQRVSDRLAYLSDLLDTIEGTDYANMVTELKAKLEELSTYSSKIEELEAFNDRLSEQLEPMVGLNYEEINDFHERVNGALINLQEVTDEISGDLENIKENLTNAFEAKDAEIAEINSQIENLQNFATVVQEEYATNESVEAAFDRLGTTLDKLQKQADATDTDLKNIEENLTNAFEAKDAEIAEINGQLENLQNFATVVQEEYATNESVESMATNYDALIEKVQNNVGVIGNEVEGLSKDMEDVKANVKDMGADVAQIEGLANDIEALQNENTKLKSQIANLEAMIENLQEGLMHLMNGETPDDTPTPGPLNN